jgi:hypothetical protein
VRGYAFLTGDELPYPSLSKRQVEHVCGDRLDSDLPTPAVVAALEETWRPFFLIPDLARRNRCERRWRDLLGDHVIAMESPEDTCRVAAGIVALGQGLLPDVEALAKVLAGLGTPRDRVAATVRALDPFACAVGRDGAPAPRLERRTS